MVALLRLERSVERRAGSSPVSGTISASLAQRESNTLTR